MPNFAQFMIERFSKRLRARRMQALTAFACWLVVASAGLVMNADASAQGAKSLRIIVPLSAGGGADILARILAEQVNRAQGATVIVENRPGAGTAIGTDFVARAAPDGSTLLITNPAFLINPHIRPQNYDPMTSFEPICNIVSFPLFVVVAANSPYRTLAELIDAARAKPGSLTFASAGPATASHIALEALRLAAQVEVTYVPFAGTAPAITALLGGHVAAVYADYTSVSEQIKSGALRALSVGSLKRFPGLPDVPTVVESGYANYEQESWNGVLAPAKTPNGVVGELRSWFSKAGESPEMKEKLALQGLAPTVACGADFTALLRRQNEQYGRSIRAANLKAQ
ncbi:Bug family tripartite tricarboxylate transporter substrate binding protein [Rhodoplanes sp. Z2-YC6860]|uniref:Bug family tripartite tricarboxylate transporter substrate binding protein n=1 Tax=Rhodoplanes sp. Z2-YC6860 TaxID=674703 RepID=UPI00078C071D|nr:tripartite tricarboxylate transporter substrate binding protein [Rhodoplanes sp. Z2-YC6860]AMN41517.1 carnitinyl-CoA dehydratase CaiD [Rhodoplanes sp. Z2-YC6860]